VPTEGSNATRDEARATTFRVPARSLVEIEQQQSVF